MNKHVFFHRLLIFIVSVTMIFSITSCSQQRKPMPIPTKSKQQENKPPKELDDLSKAIEKMEKTLYDMYERNKKPLFIQQEEIKKQTEKKGQQGKGQEEQGGQQQQGQQGGGAGGSSGQQQGQGSQASELELVTPKDKLLEFQYQAQQMKIEVERANLTQFEQLKKDVMKLHGLWNAYEAKAVSQYVMQSSIIDFENTLNGVTKSLEKNDAYQSLLDVTQLYKYLPDFYIAYSSKSPPELGKIRFAAKKIYLLSEKSNYGGAKENLDYLTGVWSLTRSRLSQDNKDMINKLEFAITDLKNAIEAKNNMIILAKTDVILKIADEIEKAMEKGQKK